MEHIKYFAVGVAFMCTMTVLSPLFIISPLFLTAILATTYLVGRGLMS